MSDIRLFRIVISINYIIIPEIDNNMSVHFEHLKSTLTVYEQLLLLTHLRRADALLLLIVCEGFLHNSICISHAGFGPPMATLSYILNIWKCL